MRTLSFEYVTDSNGQKSSVLLNFNEWERIVKDLEELDRLREKQDFFFGLKEAFEEVKLIKHGKKKPNSFKDLINELRSNSDR
jgi:hypothetical protein